MSALITDLRHGLRALRRGPGFATAALATLALGIGVCTAAFSVLDAVLLRPLPWPDADRLMRVAERLPGPPGRVPTALSVDTFRAWSESSTQVEQLAAYAPRSWALEDGGEPELLRGAAVSPSLFPMLRVRPLVGRLFEPGEDAPGADRVVILSEELWRDRLAADPAVVGRRVRLDEVDHTVVGIVPRGLEFPDAETRAYTPLALPHVVNRPGERMLMVLPAVARLRPGATVEAAEAEASAISTRTLAEPDDASRRGEVRLVPLSEEMVSSVRPALIVLAGAVGLVLLIAVANLANLLLARGVGRRRELSVRAALGAGGGRLARQLLTECALLAVLGGVIGTGLAWGAVRALPALLPTDFPRAWEIALDQRALLFALGISLLTGLLFGLAPALQAARVDLRTALAEAGIASGAGRRSPGGRVRSALVVAEVALAMMLLAGAGLLVRSFERLIANDPGYDAAQLLTVNLALPPTRYDTAATTALIDRLLEALRSDPDVRAAGVTSRLPLLPGDMVIGFPIPGRPVSSRDQMPRASLRVVSPGFVAAMGIPLRAGRGLDERDVPGGTVALLVNQSFVDAYLSESDPIGLRLPGVIGGSDAEIVGVVGDVRHEGLDAEPRPELYVSYRQAAPAGVMPHMSPTLVVRTLGDPLAWSTALRRHLTALDRTLAASTAVTMEQRLSTSLTRPRLYAGLLAAFAALAVLLAAIGVYGVLARQVETRRREIGVRLALGAAPRDVERLVVGEGMRVTGLGIALGLAGAAALAPSLSALLFGVTPRDPLTFLAVALLLVVVAALTCGPLARRAARVDPAVTLRSE